MHLFSARPAKAEAGLLQEVLLVGASPTSHSWRGREEGYLQLNTQWNVVFEERFFDTALSP